jgi:hypothetical protein
VSGMLARSSATSKPPWLAVDAFRDNVTPVAQVTIGLGGTILWADWRLSAGSTGDAATADTATNAMAENNFKSGILS